MITTYLDNDDALNVDFVADVQAKACEVEDNTFICYPDGVQYFAGMNMLLKVHYPANHFISLVERYEDDAVKTVYGYGSHAYIAEKSGLKVKYYANLLQWC